MGRSPLITGVLMSEIAHPRGSLAVSCCLSSRGELIPPISHCHVDRRGGYVENSRRNFADNIVLECVMRFRDRIVSRARLARRECRRGVHIVIFN